MPGQWFGVHVQLNAHYEQLPWVELAPADHPGALKPGYLGGGGGEWISPIMGPVPVKDESDYLGHFSET